jgi:very-short-patch-repair endonuclease
VTPGQREVGQALLDGAGVVSRRDHPELASTLDWMLRRDLLVSLLPGVYVSRQRAAEPEVRVRAAALWDPDLVFTGATAARLSFWPTLQMSTVTAALPRRRRVPAGYQISRRMIPPELLIERSGLHITSPALTALDLCDDHGGDGIDTVLRSRQATLTGLHEALALTGCRTGNLLRRTLLLDSRDEPWSAAERESHKLLRAAGITGWNANFPLVISGITFYLDVAFKRQKLAIEIDGHSHHSSRSAFEHDRWRQNEIVMAGWRVLRFTWDMIVNHPHVVIEQIRLALAL